METKKLNLNKIRLYCILHNIKQWHEVPNCDNCKKVTVSCHRNNCDNILYSVSRDFKVFQLGYELYHRAHCCDKWKKK